MKITRGIVVFFEYKYGGGVGGLIIVLKSGGILDAKYQPVAVKSNIGNSWRLAVAGRLAVLNNESASLSVKSM